MAEIEWLLLLVVMLYLLAHDVDKETSAAVFMAMFFYAAFVVSLHYAYFYHKKNRWTLAAETWGMLLYITWVVSYTGRTDSPLLNLYLMVIVVSALSLGKAITLLEIMLVVACYIFLGYPDHADYLTLAYAGNLTVQLIPVILMGYITTMLSSDIRGALSKIKTLSETDELTGIFNMRAFHKMLERVMLQSERYAHAFSILMIDSDSLKAINDSMGHDAGNRLLRNTVKAIQDNLRQTDVIARFGGDEFIVLLPETSARHAMDVAERIRATIESSPLNERGKQMAVTASLGIASFPEHGKDADVIIERADRAMYLSKNAGKNRVTLYNGR